MTLAELRRELFNICDDAGGIAAWLRDLKKTLKKKEIPSHGYVSAAIRGDAKPGKKILKAMGKKRVLSLDKKTEMKFEDI